MLGWIPRVIDASTPPSNHYPHPNHHRIIHVSECFRAAAIHCAHHTTPPPPSCSRPGQHGTKYRPLLSGVLCRVAGQRDESAFEGGTQGGWGTGTRGDMEIIGGLRSEMTPCHASSRLHWGLALASKPPDHMASATSRGLVPSARNRRCFDRICALTAASTHFGFFMMNR